MNGICPWCGKVTDRLARARDIVAEVAGQHQLSTTCLYERNREAYIVAARACAIRRIRDETGLKLAAIGELFGLDHTTVIHHLNGQRSAADRRQRGEP